MVLNVLMGMLSMFEAIFLIWWSMKTPIYDNEELIELVMQVIELMEAFGVLM